MVQTEASGKRTTATRTAAYYSIDKVTTHGGVDSFLVFTYSTSFNIMNDRKEVSFKGINSQLVSSIFQEVIKLLKKKQISN